MNEEEIREELEKMNCKLKDEKVRKNTVDSNVSKAKNQSINYDDYDIDDLIEKPKLQSVPKYTYDDTMDESNFEFDIKEYSMKLQGYAKEKSRIQHDEEYRLERGFLRLQAGARFDQPANQQDPDRAPANRAGSQWYQHQFLRSGGDRPGWCMAPVGSGEQT